jgi:hypothetical protein
MFGIVQGGDQPDLRIRSARRAQVGMDLKGYAIGGLAVGEPQAVMLSMFEKHCRFCRRTKPRYLMGVGTPDDILKAVARGIDMFDCVMPTRSGRHGLAFTRRGRINIRNARHAEDMRPLDEDSSCPAARDYSRAYLHHLVRSDEALGGMLLSWNNLSYYQDLMFDEDFLVDRAPVLACLPATEGEIVGAVDRAVAALHHFEETAGIRIEGADAGRGMGVGRFGIIHQEGIDLVFDHQLGVIDVGGG